MAERVTWERGAFDDAAIYDGFMGRYAVQFAPQFADLVGIGRTGRALDVGCGTGALTAELARRLGPGAVRAIDPSRQFLAAAHERNPGVVVQRGVAEALPFDDGEFDFTLAQLAVGHTYDPPAALAEMARVTAPGGIVATCEWMPSGPSPYTPFITARATLDPGYYRPRPGRQRRVDRLRALGVVSIETAEVTASVRFECFEDWWAPVSNGVGPSSTYVRTLDPESKARLRALCGAELPSGSFELPGVALAVKGVVPKAVR
jgi:SAM-dependent methyltransferase